MESSRLSTGPSAREELQVPGTVEKGSSLFVQDFPLKEKLKQKNIFSEGWDKMDADFMSSLFDHNSKRQEHPECISIIPRINCPIEGIGTINCENSHLTNCTNAAVKVSIDNANSLSKQQMVCTHFTKLEERTLHFQGNRLKIKDLHKNKDIIPSKIFIFSGETLKPCKERSEFYREDYNSDDPDVWFDCAAELSPDISCFHGSIPDYIQKYKIVPESTEKSSKFCKHSSRQLENNDSLSRIQFNELITRIIYFWGCLLRSCTVPFRLLCNIVAHVQSSEIEFVSWPRKSFYNLITWHYMNRISLQYYGYKFKFPNKCTNLLRGTLVKTTCERGNITQIQANIPANTLHNYNCKDTMKTIIENRSNDTDNNCSVVACRNVCSLLGLTSNIIHGNTACQYRIKAEANIDASTNYKTLNKPDKTSLDCSKEQKKALRCTNFLLYIAYSLHLCRNFKSSTRSKSPERMIQLHFYKRKTSFFLFWNMLKLFIVNAIWCPKLIILVKTGNKYLQIVKSIFTIRYLHHRNILIEKHSIDRKICTDDRRRRSCSFWCLAMKSFALCRSHKSNYINDTQDFSCKWVNRKVIDVLVYIHNFINCSLQNQLKITTAEIGPNQTNVVPRNFTKPSSKLQHSYQSKSHHFCLINKSNGHYCFSTKLFVLTVAIFVLSQPGVTEAGSPDAKRLYDDLLSNYNKLVRPVVNVTNVLTVRIKLKLSQLIDVVSICH